ncbi:MAG TPA: ABC transporter permease [Atribacteraceae bacterium]|nr:ABC transporter permease [Atribacteraceae bacterium]
MSRMLRVEKRLTQTVWQDVFVTLLSLVLALLFGAVFLRALGVSPWEAYSEMFRASMGDFFGVTETIGKATPIMIAGVGVLLAFKMSVWNIGAAGQAFIGALAATTAVRYFFVDNRFVMFWIMLALVVVTAGSWSAIAGYLKARWNVNEIITTLMLNYIALQILYYFVYGPWRDPASLGFPMTAPFPLAARLPFLGETRIHIGLILAVILAIVFWYVFRSTRWGYEIRVMGQSPRTARFAGMNYGKNVVLVMFLSGAIAGIAGMGEIAGLAGRLQPGFTADYGYTAIIVAWLARLNPLAIPLVSFLIGALQVGGETLQIVMRLPLASTLVLQGLVLFFVLGGEFFRFYRIRLVREVSD